MLYSSLISRRPFHGRLLSAGVPRPALLGVRSSASSSWRALLGGLFSAGVPRRASLAGVPRRVLLGGLLSARFSRRAGLGVRSSACSALGGLQ